MDIIWLHRFSFIMIFLRPLLCIHPVWYCIILFLWMTFDVGASQVVLLVKNPSGNSGDPRDSGPIPELGRSPGVGNGTLLQYSCLENSMGRGAWQATVHRVVELDTTERPSTQHRAQDTSFLFSWKAVLVSITWRSHQDPIFNKFPAYLPWLMHVAMLLES